MYFKPVYSFQIIDYVKKGVPVYALDKKTREVMCVNDMPVVYFTKLVSEESAIMNRAEFWIEEVEKTEGEVENKEE